MCTRSGLYLGLCPASWAITAIGPLAQVDICGIISKSDSETENDILVASSSSNVAAVKMAEKTTLK
jgi:hypothetical protein